MFTPAYDPSRLRPQPRISLPVVQLAHTQHDHAYLAYKHMHVVARTPTPPPTKRVPQSPTDRFIQRSATTSHHAAMTPQTDARKTRHTRSALVKFFADRPSRFRGKIDTTAHPEAYKHEDWADFVKRVFKDEVARAVKKEAQQETQSSQSSKSESTTPYTWVIDKGTPKSFEDGRSKLANSIAARQACSSKVIKRTGIGSLLERRDETILRNLIEGNFVTEKSHQKNHMRPGGNGNERKRERCDSPSYDSSGEGRPLIKRQHLSTPATILRRFIVLQVVSYRGELVELAVVDTSIDCSIRPWQKVLNAISNPKLDMERARGYTPAMRTKPSGCAYLPDRPADGIMMFESDVSARRVLSIPLAGQADEVMVVLFDGGDKENTQRDRARTLIKEQLRPPPPWTGDKTPQSTQRQSVGAIIDLTDDNVQPSDSDALPKRP
jgi:hypothetical protein